MQIHAGQYKGRRVKTVKNSPYRPTTSLVRKSLFDILGDISGKHVLDLFAGSGIIGFEAGSRRCRFHYFCRIQHASEFLTQNEWRSVYAYEIQLCETGRTQISRHMWNI